MPPLSRGALGYLKRTSHARFASGISRSQSTTRNQLFHVAEEVEHALRTGQPVVALESTIYTHGYPYPENVALASHLESLVRINGAIPATIGIVDGKAHVGMRPETLIKLISTAGDKDTWKISRRDLGLICGLGMRGKLYNGGTTIAGTMILAHLAGIKLFATGGLGGVHRGGENSLDISADLTELGRTPVAVISSGCKSFLDIPRTLEYLETQGVGVGTFADGRSGPVDFPAFWARDSGVRSPQTIEDESDAAAIIHAQFSLPVKSGLHFANPVPVDAAMSRKQIDGIISQAVVEAEEKGITGSANTPYILKRIKELSKGASLTANSALIEANVIRGTKVAVELAKLERQEHSDVVRGPLISSIQVPPQYLEDVQSSSRSSTAKDFVAPVSSTSTPVDVLVAGSLACDTICDYTPFLKHSSDPSPALHTSNPAAIGQSAGGVGRNVAIAASLAGAHVAFASAVADDIAGLSLVEQVRQSGLDTTLIRQLHTKDGAKTAQYVAFNDVKSDLVVAMADMAIFTRTEFEDPTYWSRILADTKPKWLVLDANWSPKVMSAIITSAKAHSISIAFEPVSKAKAANLFDRANSALTSGSVVPDNVVNLATPNVYELRAMHEAAQNAGFLETEQWWTAINNFGLSSSGSREKFIYTTNEDLVNRGVPQQSIQLLPYIPCIATKLGSQGVLLTTLLKQDDPRLTSPDYAPYILSRNDSGKGPVGGVYMRLFAPAEMVNASEIQSVNGVGDTLLGVLIAGISKHSHKLARVEDHLSRAQQAAVLTLKSKEAVSLDIRMLR